MRLIDADALSNRFVNRQYYDAESIWGKIDTAPTVSGWISVKDGLPEGECIAYSRKFGEMMMGFIGETDESDTGYCCDSNTEWLGDVTHWMQKPKPPKEEENAAD